MTGTHPGKKILNHIIEGVQKFERLHVVEVKNIEIPHSYAELISENSGVDIVKHRHLLGACLAFTDGPIVLINSFFDKKLVLDDIDITLERKNMKKIICGFPGVGKTEACKQFGWQDSDSTDFSWADEAKTVRHPDWPNNYIEHLKASDGVILVSTHAEVRKALIDAGIPHSLCFPMMECKEEYVQRYIDRGSPPSFVRLLKAHWESWIDGLTQDDKAEMRYILQPGQYLSVFKDDFEPYDSAPDTHKHINRVEDLLILASNKLLHRGRVHDDSKLKDPEKAIFDEMTPKLKGSTYGSDEYKDFLKQMKPALDHHYANNSHHPEHYENGVNGMSLLDLVEMLIDWKAAGERHADGNIKRSLEINKDRFEIGDQLQSILENTAREFGWLTGEV